ncbi:hypothetical protein ACPPVW_02100 [Leifsonia sp. McL0607]|uniref:hypothetical protein n=1 Tax=Leifsonia sp. McL0607 TaxID=3415672 RepID=UPI003CE76281
MVVVANRFPSQWVISPIGGVLVNNANYTFSWMANHQYSLNVDPAPAALPGANAVLARTFNFPSQWWRAGYNPDAELDIDLRSDLMRLAAGGR